MSPQAQAAFDEIKARLAERTREADLWDMSGRDERLHLLRKSYRARRNENPHPSLVPKPSASIADRQFDDLDTRAKNIVTVACRPLVLESEQIARNGIVAV